MPDILKHELLFKREEAFERALKMLNLEGEKPKLDFNLIIKEPEYFEGYLSRFPEETCIKAAAYYIYEKYDIESNGLAEFDVKKALFELLEVPMCSGRAFIPKIVKAYSDYSRLLQEKENLEEFKSFQDFEGLGERALLAIGKDDCIDLARWRMENWDTDENMPPVKINKFKKSISFFGARGELDDLDKLVLELARKLDTDIYYRYCETSRFSFAGETWFRGGETFTRLCYQEGINLFNILGSMLDEDGEK